MIQVPNSPAALGLGRWKSWRPFQESAVHHIVNNPGRFAVQCLPTGSGKSLVAMAATKLLECKTVILTATKALQDQYERDFGNDVLVLKGSNSYRCNASLMLSADMGHCRYGEKCDLMAGGCTFYDQIRKAVDAKVVVTNYSMWLNLNRLNNPIENVGLLVCDEGHRAYDILLNSLAVSVGSSTCKGFTGQPIPFLSNIEECQDWAANTLEELAPQVEDARLKALRSGTATARSKSNEASQLLDKLARLSMADESWALTQDHSNNLTALPVYKVYSHAHWLLYGQSARIALMSATLSARDLPFIGIPKSTQVLEIPSCFPIENRLVVHIPTIKVSHGVKESELVSKWIGRIDEIIEAFPDQKGIVHCGSFARQKLILEHSRYKSSLLVNGSHNTSQIINQFKSATGRAVLVSPSVAEGYDFPHELCRFQIIGKMPFPNVNDPIVEIARLVDRGYMDRVAMQTLQQESGRGNRAEDDFCITFIIDDNITWFMTKNRPMATDCFLESFRRSHSLKAVMKVVSFS